MRNSPVKTVNAKATRKTSAGAKEEAWKEKAPRESERRKKQRERDQKAKAEERGLRK